jgi:phage portal protein BeeE
MPFATTKAASDGMVASTQSHLRGLIKAGSGSSIAQLVAAGSGGGFAGFASGFSKGGKAREAYKMLRNWVAAATTAIATRCSNQTWMAGHYATSGAEERRPGRLTSKGYDREKFPLSMVKGYGTDIEPDQEHNVLWVLDKPNHLQGKTEFIEILVMNLLLTGEFYFIGGVTNKDDDRSLELWAVPSSWLVPDHGKRLFGGYKLQTGMGGGEGVPIPAENVCRGYFPDPSDIKGCLSPLQACLSAARIDDFILHSQEQSFERGIHPNLIVSVGKTLDADGKQTQRRPVLAPRQRTQITRSIMHAWNQTVNQGMPAIIDGLIEDIKKLSNTPSEMDWMQSGLSVKARLMQGFKVNPIVLGEVTPANKAQAVVAEQQVCKGAVNPILGKISCAASEFFSPFYEDGETLAVWLEQCNPKDDEMEFKQMTQGRQTGDITQEEYRNYLGLPAIEDPEPKRSPLFNNPQVLAAIAALAAQVSAGAMTHDNAVATLMVSLQISREQAGEMMPDDPPEPPPMLPGQVPGQPGAPGTPPGPPAGPQTAQEPKPGPKPPADEEDEEEGKGYNPDQPRDDHGRWGEGSGGSAPDTGDGSGAGGSEGGSTGSQQHSYGGDHGSTVKVDDIGQIKLTKPKDHAEATSQLEAMNKIMDAAMKDVDNGVPRAGLRLHHAKAQLARAMGYAQKVLKKKDADDDLIALIAELSKKYGVDPVDPDETDEPTLDDKSFNPDQPRDPDGRFASGGAAADTGDGTGAQGTSPSSPEPRVYADASDAAEFQDKYKSWTKNLSSDELSAVARYSETDSIQINAKLRGKKADVEALAATLGEDVVRTPEEIDDAIKQIDSAIEKAPALDESIKVYRTFNDDFVRKNYKKLSGGIVEAGYTSTTILKENLDHIPRGKDAMTAEITIPKGAKGAYIGSNINDLAEDEFLLPKRSYYQFTGSSKDKATGHITVQMTYDPHFWDT